MDEIKIIRKLASAMEGDEPPAIDVVGRVMDEVEDLEHPSARVMWFFTASAAAAAIIIAVLAIQAIPDQPDPMMQFIGGVMR